MTVVLPWNAFDLKSLPSNAQISNELEIFPATLISYPIRFKDKKLNTHCALFPSGKAVVTGVTSVAQASNVLTCVVHNLM